MRRPTARWRTGRTRRVGGGRPGVRARFSSRRYRPICRGESLCRARPRFWYDLTRKGKIREVFNGEIVFGAGRLQGGVGVGGEKSVETCRDVIGRVDLVGFCKGFVVIVFKQIGVLRGRITPEMISGFLQVLVE